MATTKKLTEPPRHLSSAMRKWWRSVARDFQLEPHQLHLLRLAAEAYDRAQGARIVLDKEGITYFDRFDQPKARPETTVERDARRDFAALVKALGFPEPPVAG
jgi:P27 family predicted phage terminase small subunit